MQDTRLEMIYNLLPPGRLCDVGTDHCKLAVMAVVGNKAPFAAATDINRGPLEAAKKTVERHGLCDKITLLLSDGFADIPDDIFESTDCFVIAGMGGELIESILRARKTDKYLVLQPMSAVYELCEFLCKNGYEIQKRVFCSEGDKIYTALLCRFDGCARDYYPFMSVEKNGDFYRFLKREITRLEKAILGMKKGEHVDNFKIDELEKLKNIIVSEMENENK